MHSVSIFGAGIAGLSAAHELAEAGYKVSVYEMYDIPGGVARSYRYPENNGTPSEYSWRGYGGFYKNVFNLMQRIPYQDGTVYSKQLSRPIHFYQARDELTNIDDTNNWQQNFTMMDKYHIITALIRDFVADKRADYYATINAHDYFKNKLSPLAFNLSMSIIGPWIGIDPQRASLHHSANFSRLIKYPNMPPFYHKADRNGPAWLHTADSEWLVLNRPTNESWFDPWVNFLKTKYGVKFYFNHKLERFITQSNTIVGAIISNDTYQIIKSDYYILATGPFAAEKIISDSNLSGDPELGKFRGLIADGPHNQISFRIGFSKKINMPQKYMAIIMPDSEFNITFYAQDHLWEDDVYLGPGIKSLFSGTACATYNIGKLFGKPATELSKEEFLQEIVYQLYRSKNLNALIADSNNGLTLDAFPIQMIDVWPEWDFNKGGTVKTNEPKWVTSCTTERYLPNMKTGFGNLLLAGSHTKVTFDLYSMEGAAESGRRAAYHILNRDPTQLFHTKPFWMQSLSKLDNIFYNLNLPSIFDILIFMFAIIFIIIILRIILIQISNYKQNVTIKNKHCN